MSNAKRDARLIELVAAFTEMGPAWIRWVEAAIPDESVSFVRLRMLNALERHPDGLTMTQLATALDRGRPGRALRPPHRPPQHHRRTHRRRASPKAEGLGGPSSTGRRSLR
jgi:hypothetical protein